MKHNFVDEFYIANRLLSDDSPVFIVAEAGVNHNGDTEIARKLIDAAVEVGADAVKFQAFKSESLILDSVDKAPYQQTIGDSGESQFEMLKRLELSKADALMLRDYCMSKHIIYLTTPFDEDSLESLNEFNLPAYKVASTDITNVPFLRAIAKKGKPIILSTGMSNIAEVEYALTEIGRINRNVVLLQCTANYPIEEKEANLAVIQRYKNEFEILVGFSDHSEGIGASPYAVAAGAKVIEKHFTLSRGMDGPDHAASLEPDELCRFVEEIRKVERLLGNGIKTLELSEVATRRSLQKSLVAKKRIEIGEVFTQDNIGAKRTGGIGISPIYCDRVYGCQAKKVFLKDEIIE